MARRSQLCQIVSIFSTKNVVLIGSTTDSVVRIATYISSLTKPHSKRPSRCNNNKSGRIRATMITIAQLDLMIVLTKKFGIRSSMTHRKMKSPRQTLALKAQRTFKMRIDISN